jgi:hypothetical protein
MTKAENVVTYLTRFTQVRDELGACLSTRTTHSSVWYIDSGASRHMTGVHKHLTDLTQIGELEVVLGDDWVVKAVCSGTISFQRESLPPMLLREVLYVLGSKTNLVSVSAIEEMGYKVLFHKGQVLLFHKGSSITSAKVIGTRHEKLYKLMFQPASALCHSTISSDLCELWYRRMAHLFHGALRILREIVTGVPEFSTEHQELCEGCALGKYTKTLFPSSDSRAAGILDLIHSDVCGLMSSASLTGC